MQFRLIIAPGDRDALAAILRGRATTERRLVHAALLIGAGTAAVTPLGFGMHGLACSAIGAVAGTLALRAGWRMPRRAGTVTVPGEAGLMLAQDALSFCMQGQEACFPWGTIDTVLADRDRARLFVIDIRESGIVLPFGEDRIGFGLALRRIGLQTGNRVV